jgi:hypothetical protein
MGRPKRRKHPMKVIKDDIFKDDVDDDVDEHTMLKQQQQQQQSNFETVINVSSTS